MSHITLLLQEAEAVCPVPIVRGECLLKYHLRPQQEWQRSVGIFLFPGFGCWLEAAFQRGRALCQNPVQVLSGGCAGF